MDIRLNLPYSHIWKAFIPPNEERVAVIVGYDTPDGITITNMIAIPNRWRGDRRNHYTIRKTDIAKVSLNPGEKILGHAHSHINTDRYTPSDDDLRFIKPGELGAVFHVASHKITWYDKRGPLKTIVISMPQKYRSLALLSA